MRLLPALALVLSVAGGTAAHAAETVPADRFLDALRPLCGQAFQGRIAVNEPANPDDPFNGKTLVMHVRGCEAGRIAIPFHVGEDRSRTWVLSRTETGLRLKHDHRHADGSEDELTQYGGDTTAPGSAERQEFPADAFSKDLFTRTGRTVSVPNVWAMAVEPGKSFTYELARPGRLFRVEFDLTTPVPAPPAPWGHE
ncbi:MAG: hypothetical protein RLY86_1508 [Pseudomonadota bacterium]|jgi:hypothetical protein